MTGAASLRALHIWGAPAAMLGSEAGVPDSSCGRGRSLSCGSSKEQWAAFNQGMGFYECLDSSNFFLAVERTSEIMWFSALAFRGRMGITESCNLPEVSKPDGGQSWTRTELSGSHCVLFAKTTDQTTTGLVILVGNSQVFHYRRDETST